MEYLKQKLYFEIIRIPISKNFKYVTKERQSILSKEIDLNQ